MGLFVITAEAKGHVAPRLMDDHLFIYHGDDGNELSLKIFEAPGQNDIPV